MPLPILSVAEMRNWESATWAAGMTPDAVIARVGRALANALLERTSPGERVLLLAGRGHNGDDVRAAERWLQDREVRLISVVDPDAACAAIDALANESVPWRPDCCVDGLFGIGLNRSLDARWIRLLERVNQFRCPIASVDVPSGLDADTGLPRGGAVRADWTFTIGTPKSGLVETHAAEWVGRLEVLADVGLLDPSGMSTTPGWASSDLLWSHRSDFDAFPPRRKVNSHKGTYGHVVIAAGSMGYHGAAVLAARGAQSMRPGLVTVLTPEESYLPVASQLASVMVRPWLPEGILPESATALVVGPGLAANGMRERYESAVGSWWLQWPGPMVVDASALDWIRSLPSPPANALRVLTPHPGEAARWLGCDASEVNRNRSRTLRRMADRGEWVVLKGHQTRLGTLQGPIRVNSTGNPGLAQGGTGDVLAGALGGLLAQRACAANPSEAIAYGVWEHGAAADRLEARRRNWRAEELASELGSMTGRSRMSEF
jgi:NAD(P)H-hydrate epimerase